MNDARIHHGGVLKIRYEKRYAEILRLCTRFRNYRFDAKIEICDITWFYSLITLVTVYLFLWCWLWRFCGKLPCEKPPHFCLRPLSSCAILKIGDLRIYPWCIDNRRPVLVLHEK